MTKKGLRQHSSCSPRIQLHTNVNLLNLLLGQNFPHPLGELDTHDLSAAVNGDAIHGRVWPCQVKVLENIGSICSRLDNLAEVHTTSLLQKHGLTRQDIDDVGEAELPQGNGFRSEEVIFRALEGLRRSRTQAKGSNSVGVPTINLVRFPT